MTAAYHDSCYLGRHNSVYNAPRNLLNSIPDMKLVEAKRNRGGSFCCGAGGGRMWMEETLGKRINQLRVEQIAESGASVIATACPYCLTMLGDGIKEKGMESMMSVLDITEILDKAC